jgi:hypothetical protein
MWEEHAESCPNCGKPYCEGCPSCEPEVAASLTAGELAPLLPSKIYQQAGTYLMCRCCKAVSLFHRGWHDHDEDCVLAELLKAALPGIKVVRV